MAFHGNLVLKAEMESGLSECWRLNSVSPIFQHGSPKPLGPKDVVGFRDGYLKGIKVR